MGVHQANTALLEKHTRIVQIRGCKTLREAPQYGLQQGVYILASCLPLAQAHQRDHRAQLQGQCLLAASDGQRACRTALGFLAMIPRARQQ